MPVDWSVALSPINVRICRKRIRCKSISMAEAIDRSLSLLLCFLCFSSSRFPSLWIFSWKLCLVARAYRSCHIDEVLLLMLLKPNIGLSWIFRGIVGACNWRVLRMDIGRLWFYHQSFRSHRIQRDGDVKHSSSNPRSPIWPRASFGWIGEWRLCLPLLWRDLPTLSRLTCGCVWKEREIIVDKSCLWWIGFVLGMSVVGGIYIGLRSSRE